VYGSGFRAHGLGFRVQVEDLDFLFKVSPERRSSGPTIHNHSAQIRDSSLGSKVHSQLWTFRRMLVS
jgi:hypothetical protein